MKLSALALDYDGTIAVDGVFEPAVRDAVGEARERGIVVIGQVIRARYETTAEAP